MCNDDILPLQATSVKRCPSPGGDIVQERGKPSRKMPLRASFQKVSKTSHKTSAGTRPEAQKWQWQCSRRHINAPHPPSPSFPLPPHTLKGFSDETSDHVNTINISEALTLLREKLDDPDRGTGLAAKDAANPVLSKTIEYLEAFSRYKDLDTVKQLRK